MQILYQVAMALRVAEERIGSLSSSQRQFVILNAKKNVLIETGKKRKRSMEEDDLLKTLQSKTKNSGRDLVGFDQRLPKA